MSYTQFSKEERFKIEACLLAGFNQKECALRLSRSESTVSREIWRNSDPDTGHYDARCAHQRTRKRRRKPDKKLSGNQELTQTIADWIISKYWSPEEIAGVLRKQDADIHFMTIYRWIYAERRDLIPFLRHGKKYRWRRKRGTKIRELQRELGKKRWIHERSEVIEERRRIGDWEGDTILGSEKTERIATFVDRRSGFLVARRTDATAQNFRIQTKIAFKKIPKKKKITFTFDNGSEMAEHELIERDTGATVYFAHPYCSHERGTNENTNGLLREFFPKKTPFAMVTQKELNLVVKLLNDRPRKRLNYRTPAEVFNCG
jgi:IS30 family transposase